MTSSEWLRCFAVLLTLVHLCDGASMSLRDADAAAPGDPALGRSPGPRPPPPPLVGLTSDSAKHGLVDQHQQLTIVMTADTVDTGGPCDLDGDLIVVDADKAAVNMNITHDLFHSHVLTHDVQYRERHNGHDREKVARQKRDWLLHRLHTAAELVIAEKKVEG
ncbi:hypothetical protein CBL_12011 [Carabus blaptoides fortunei]